MGMIRCQARGGQIVTEMNCLLLLCLVTCASAASSGQQTYSLNEAYALFEEFIVNHNKQYADEIEKKLRFKIFNQTLVTINELNERHNGIKVFGINHFSDFTALEMEKLKGFKSSDVAQCPTVKTDSDIQDAGAPDSWDWRDRNVVTAAKDQTPCGSCYAFSATGNIEGQYAIKHGQLLSLSEQQIVDCFNGKHYDQGCQSGIPAGTLLAIMESDGIEKEDDYPYIRKEGTCKFNASKAAVKVIDCNNFNLISQEKLKQLLYKNGPLAVGIDSSYLGNYHNKVIKQCPGTYLDHAVLLVGYGTDPTQGDYWLLKNSWGSTWGDAGFFRIERGEGLSSCGMMNIDMTSAVVA